MAEREEIVGISSKQLAELTGATYRQIDYWCRQGMIHAINQDTPGSGYWRHFDSSIVDKVKLIVRISAAFDRKNSPMKYILDHYEDGVFDMGDGIQLTWDTVAIERES